MPPTNATATGFNFTAALGVVGTGLGLLGTSLKNKGAEIEANYSLELAKIQQTTLGNAQAYALAKATLDAKTQAEVDTLKAKNRTQTLYVVAAVVVFLGILTTAAIVLTRRRR